MNPVVHFEMPAKDMKRMKDFYGKVFGWTAKDMGANMGDYVVVTTSEIDEKTHFPKQPGRINGGLMPKAASTIKAPSIVIAVDDIEEHVKIVKAQGGKLIGEIMDIPHVGKMVYFEDTEGNVVSMIQPSPMM